jgi:hypothetical protein
MLSMHSLVQRLRQLLLALLLILCAAWISGEAFQWLLRWRAVRLLADIQTLQVNRSTWPDAQRIAEKWAQWGNPKPGCSAEACTVQFNLIQTLPPFLVGSPDAGARNVLPRIVDHAGLRSAAARAGFTVEHGIVTARWFGEQVTLPVREWGSPNGYIPYLSASSEQTSHFREIAGDSRLLHPNRMIQHKESYVQLTYSPSEDPAEQSALMGFRFSCLTQLRPCESVGDLLPEGQRMLLELKLTPPSR